MFPVCACKEWLGCGERGNEWAWNGKAGGGVIMDGDPFAYCQDVRTLLSDTAVKQDTEYYLDVLIRCVYSTAKDTPWD